MQRNTESSLRRPTQVSHTPPHMSCAFQCPISLNEVHGFVAVTAVGQAYEPAALQTWFGAGHVTDPVTGIRLPCRDVVLLSCDSPDVLAAELGRIRHEWFLQAQRDTTELIATVVVPTRHALSDNPFAFTRRRGSFDDTDVRKSFQARTQAHDSYISPFRRSHRR